MDDIDFLSEADVLAIHSDQLKRHGGRDGVIDQNAVLSAAGSTQAPMFGRFLNEDIAEMAASYLFGFAASQGFVDGNKRTGGTCATGFLACNGYQLNCNRPRNTPTLLTSRWPIAGGKMDIGDAGNFARLIASMIESVGW